MVQVCERAVSKQAMLERSLEQYKEMYRVVKDNWGTVVLVRIATPFVYCMFKLHH